MRRIAVLAGAVALTGCATTKPIETATIECRVVSSIGELQSCVLVSQTVANSSFGTFALQQASSGKYVADKPADAQGKVQFTVRGRAGD